MKLRETRARTRTILLVGAQLGVVFTAASWLRTERDGLPRLIAIAGTCFLLISLVPAAWRAGVSLAASLAGGAFVLAGGRDFGALSPVVVIEAILLALALLAVACAVIAILRLPIPRLARAALLLAAGGVLAWARWKQAWISDAQWRLLGAIFMFRTIVYAYEVLSADRVERWRDSLSYFLVLPAFHFPLFPVVDYATFKRSGGGDPCATAQCGVNWMALGVLELALYRVIYHRVQVGPEDVDSFLALLRFVLPPYLLYLNVSGQFHLITGMLHLFGWRLPEANRNWLLADSFTDFWRRINVYWKDFMVRVFYFPAYFRLRRRSERLALVAATALVFAATTLLHGWQSFWLRGEFTVTAQDLLFWGTLGALVVVGIVRESGRSTPAAAARRGFGLRRVAAIAGVWLTISLLWSIWSSPSLAEWWTTVTQWGRA